MISNFKQGIIDLGYAISFSGFILMQLAKVSCNIYYQIAILLISIFIARYIYKLFKDN